ncbi:MAG: four-carbon acid sugar kinase family protein [Lachnospiraceae bacterium]
MSFLLIIADDFTGALDTGVQFAARGVPTRVVVNLDVEFTTSDVKVLVVDTETRHLPAAKAYDVVAKLTERALQAGVSYIYKKTDSALRGNIGAELAAVLKSSGYQYLPFLPAFPQTGRTTCNGIHYIDGVPVTESPFGIDPFEPVKHAVVTELIGEQCGLPTKSLPALTKEDDLLKEEGILVFDAANVDDLYATGYQLLHQDGLHIMAGCAGFAAVLPELLGIAVKNSLPFPKLDPRLLVICGSVNPITRTQLDKAEKEGFIRQRLTPYQKLTLDYWQSSQGRTQLIQIEEMLRTNPHCIIETNDCGGNEKTADYAVQLGIDHETLRVRIASSLGHLVGEIFTSPFLGTLLLTGGDTLLQCMNCIGVGELEPLCEVERGVVLASFTYHGCKRHVITKSGGFGQENLLVDLSSRIVNGEIP